MPGSLSSVGEETGGLLPLCCPSLPWGPNQFSGLLQIFRNPRGHLLHYLQVQRHPLVQTKVLLVSVGPSLL